MATVAINGLGRIGRAALNIILDTPQLELKAINDLVPPDNLAYLLRYDTVYGRSPHRIESGKLIGIAEMHLWDVWIARRNVQKF